MLTALCVAAVSLPTLASPILTESANGYGLLATVYPDHADKKKVYFFPNRGVVERDRNNEPVFGMVHWGTKTPDPTDGGGLLNVNFNLALGGDLPTVLEKYQEQKFQTVVMPVQSSELVFMERDGVQQMSNIYEGVSLPPYSGRAEDSIALSTSLSEVGAKALKKLLTGSNNALTANYCYQVHGVSPIFDAKIKLNFKKVYEHFVSQASFRKWWIKVNIRTEIQKLVERESIKIEINGGTANQYDYIMALVDRMITRFFIPKTQNAKAKPSGSFSVAYARTEEDREHTYHLTQREYITRDFCIGIPLSEIKNYPHLVVDADQ